MRWLSSGSWKVSIAITGILFLLALTVWISVSSAGTHEVVSGLAFYDEMT